MSTLFWKALKLSPALLGASLLFASSAYAQKSAPDQTVANSTEIAVVPSTDQPQTQVVASSTPAKITSEQPVAIATSSSVVPSESSIAASTDLISNPATETKISQLTSSEGSAQENSADNTLAQQVPATGNSTSNSTEVLEQIEQYQQFDGGSSQSQQDNGGTDVNALDQVTNVTQLSDVRPTDWAYEALRSLVERYGCIAGYPDGTYRGNRALTRYEFAAGLNACLQQIERLIATSTSEFVTRSDLETLQRLVDEFRAELTALGTRTDTLEGRVAYLEDRQFSTTTKLKGEVIFGVADALGDEVALASPNPGPNSDLDVNTILGYRARLNFETSFTGRDRLRTRLEASNITPFDREVTGTNMTRLSYDGNNNSDVEISELWYRFFLSKNLVVQVDATRGEFNDTVINTVNPLFESSGSGSISRFGRFNPIYRVGQGAGASATYNFSDALGLSVGYFANDGENPAEKNGLFDGNYSAMAQLTLGAGEFATLGLTYVHSYYRGGDVNVTGSTGSEFARRPFGNDVATSTNSYGVEGNLRFGFLSVGGWVGYQDAEAEATALAGSDAEAWNWAVNAALTDFGTKGSMLGVVFGMPPRARGNDVAARRDLDTSYHLEAFYRFKLNDNIAITPGVLVLFNPEHNDANENIYVGTIRTTFTF
ncbi:MAG: iron uptake porin [Cyanobacteriota bacterium]